VRDVVIETAGPNSFDGSDPHVWYIVYRIYADHHAPCDADHPGSALYSGDYDTGGHYYLHTLKGWVFMPEGRFPDYIGLWMKLTHQAGPGLTARLK
jgi:hypothetical protein